MLCENQVQKPIALLRESEGMNEEKEIEDLAQIFANKRHSSIEWGRECARIVIEAGYARTPKQDMTVEQAKNILKEVLLEKIMIIEERHHSYYGSPQEIMDNFAAVMRKKGWGNGKTHTRKIK